MTEYEKKKKTKGRMKEKWWKEWDRQADLSRIVQIT